MVCLRESLPEVREQIQNLADKLGVDYGTAKIILQENNGYDLDKAPSGAESKLYQMLLEYYNGDERKALIAKAKTYLQPFFNWFGNWTDPDATDVSKVVDENGEPLVVWHGGSNVDVFDTSGKSSSGAGIKKGDRGTYFTTIKNSAKNYEEIHSYKNFDGMMDTIEEMKYEGYSNEEINEAIKPWESVTRPFYLNIRNPKNTYFSGNSKEGYKSIVTNTSNNNDGQTITRNDTNEEEWVAFSSNQIKSIDNQGTFSTTDNNINRNRQEQKAPPSDLGLKERLFNDKDETSIGTMLTRLKKDNPQFAPLISAIQNGLSTKTKSWKIKLINFEDSIDLNEDERASAAFYRHYDHTIYVDTNASFPIKGNKVGKADMTLLHEIIHAVTHEAITNNKQLRAQLMEMLHNARRAMVKKHGQPLESLLDPSKNQNKFYGLTDIDEFLSEAITNSFFARELANIDSVNKVSFWDQFLAWIMDVFGITKGDNAYVEVYSKLHDIINNYQQYNEALEELPILSAADAEYENYLNAIYGSSSMRKIDAKKPTVDELVIKYRQLSDDIEFIEEQDGAEVHIYRNRKTGQIYKSVSDVKTDVGYGEQEDKLPEQAVQLGNFTKVRGTIMHKVLSDVLTGNFDVNNYKELSSKVIKQLQSIAKTIQKNYDIIASEQVLADDVTGIAGTADLIVKNKKTGKIIILDFKTKIKNLGDQKKSGFAYYHSSKFGKPDAEKHNFQLSMYEKMHNLYGFNIDERGIVPIEYDTDENGNITNVYISPNSKGTTLEDKGYYTIPHRSQIDQDIEQYVFNKDSDGVMDKIQLDRQSEIVGKILDTLKNKVVTLYSKGRTTQATDIENTVNEFNSLGEQEIILGYVKTALDNLKNIIDGKKGYNEHLQRERTEGNIVWNLKQLENWRDVARSFKPLEEIQQYLFDYQDILPEGTYEQIMPILDEAVRYRDILEGAYKTKGKALWIEWIKPFIKNVEASYRLKAEREYKKTHSKIDQQEMQSYINQYVENNRTKIEIETKDFINRQSMQADSDVNGFYRWVDTIFQSKDPVISGMALAYDTMIQQTNETFNVKYKQLVDLTREMEEKLGSSIFSDPKKVYGYMLEETDEGIRLIDTIPVSFTKAYKQAVGEIESDTQYKNNFERFKAKMKWLDTNAPITDKKALKTAKIKAVEDYLNSLDITQEEFDAVIDNEHKTGKNRKSYFELAKEGVISYKRADDLREISEQTTWKFRKPNPKLYKNEKMDALQKMREKDPNDIQVRFYDFIKSLSEEGDSKVAPRYKLNGRIPGMSKTSVERLAAGQNVLQVVKEQISKNISLKADDTMYGQFEMTDEQNKPINFIPVFFTNKLNESDQSYDLPTIYKEWFKSALTYANTNEIIDQLEFTRFIVNDRQTKTGGLSHMSKVWKRLNPDSQISEQWSTKDSSNLANQLNDWFDQVVYGKSTDPMGSFDVPFVGKIDNGKLIDLFTKYTSLRVMGLNYISMVNNMAMAEVAQAIETMAHQYVSPSSYTKATAEYSLELLNGNIVADVGARKPTSKINLLNELFGTFSDFDNGRMRLSNRFSRLFNSGAFYFTTNIGEHEAQSRFLIASLMEERALDSNGNDIGSIYDYYTVEDGELVFDKDGKVSNWDDNKRRQISARIRSQLMSMHGNYSPEWKVALQRNGYLKLALMFRKWIVPSWRKRWDGMYYDNVTQSYKEGYYWTGITFTANKVKQFFYKLTDESKAAEIAITADWHNLTEMEKQNVRRFGTEASIFVTLCVLYSLLKTWADDEDSVFIDNLAYQAYRLRTDMGFYTRPRDMMKIIQSPFPSTSAIKSVSNLFDSVLHPLDKYERGPWKDHYKIEKRIYDMTPIVRQLYRARDIENEYNILNMK